MWTNDTDSLYSFYFRTADNLEAYENPNVTVLADMGQVSVFSFSASHCKHILNLFWRFRRNSRRIDLLINVEESKYYSSCPNWFFFCFSLFRSIHRLLYPFFIPCSWNYLYIFLFYIKFCRDENEWISSIVFTSFPATGLSAHLVTIDYLPLRLIQS